MLLETLLHYLSTIESPWQWLGWDFALSPEHPKNKAMGWQPRTASQLSDLLVEIAFRFKGVESAMTFAESGLSKVAELLEASARILRDRQRDLIEGEVRAARVQATVLNSAVCDVVTLVEFVRDMLPAFDESEVASVNTATQNLITQLDLDVEDREGWTTILAAANLVSLMRADVLERIRNRK